jgi:hypothetical protein
MNSVMCSIKEMSNFYLGKDAYNTSKNNHNLDVILVKDLNVVQNFALFKICLIINQALTNIKCQSR